MANAICVQLFFRSLLLLFLLSLLLLLLLIPKCDWMNIRPSKLVVCQLSICLKRYLVIYLLSNGKLLRKNDTVASKKNQWWNFKRQKIIQFFPPLHIDHYKWNNCYNLFQFLMEFFFSRIMRNVNIVKTALRYTLFFVYFCKIFNLHDNCERHITIALTNNKFQFK